jgi:uncharacterized protein YaaW (UPF0174 family)
LNYQYDPEDKSILTEEKLVLNLLENGINDFDKADLEALVARIK